MKNKYTWIMLLFFAWPIVSQSQKNGPQSHMSTMSMPFFVAQNQPPTEISIPVCPVMLSVLKSLRVVDGSPDVSSLLGKLFLRPDEVDATVSHAVVSVSPAACAGSTNITFTISAAAATRIESRRVNLRTIVVDPKTSVVTYPVVFLSVSDLIVSGLKARGGFFWNYVLAYPPPDLQNSIISTGPASEATVALVTAIVQ